MTPPVRFEDQVQVVLDVKPAVFSFVFGIPSADILEECRRGGIVTVGGATTMDEAIALEAAGVDVVIAAGGEAFLACEELGAPEFHRRLLLSPEVSKRTVLTRAFTGGWAGGFRIGWRGKWPGKRKRCCRSRSKRVLCPGGEVDGGVGGGGGWLFCKH